MNTLIICDDYGNIVFTKTSEDVQKTDFIALVTTVPEGKELVGIDLETKEPIFKDIPKSELELLREELRTTKLALAELAETMLEVD